jgi:hypothetical protein
MDRYALIIMPVRVDPEFEAKRQIVRSVCGIIGLGCRLPEPNPDRFELGAAIDAIQGAHAIIADLSYARPSCYYELGLVEGAGRRAALIAAEGTEIFQHSRRDAVSFYNNLSAYEAVLGRALSVVRQGPAA